MRPLLQCDSQDSMAAAALLVQPAWQQWWHFSWLQHRGGAIPYLVLDTNRATIELLLSNMQVV
jgi:hypothetical protein